MAAIQIVIAVVCLGLTHAYPSGAPTSTCTSLQPNTDSHGQPQAGDPVHELMVSHTTAQPGDTITGWLLLHYNLPFIIQRPRRR